MANQTGSGPLDLTQGGGDPFANMTPQDMQNYLQTLAQQAAVNAASTATSSTGAYQITDRNLQDQNNVTLQQMKDAEALAAANISKDASMSNNANTTVEDYVKAMMGLQGPKDPYAYLFAMNGLNAPRGYQASPMILPQAVIDAAKSEGISLPQLESNLTGNSSLASIVSSPRFGDTGNGGYFFKQGANGQLTGNGYVPFGSNLTLDSGPQQMKVNGQTGTYYKVTRPDGSTGYVQDLDLNVPQSSVPQTVQNTPAISALASPSTANAAQRPGAGSPLLGSATNSPMTASSSPLLGTMANSSQQAGGALPKSAAFGMLGNLAPEFSSAYTPNGGIQVNGGGGTGTAYQSVAGQNGSAASLQASAGSLGTIQAPPLALSSLDPTTRALVDQSGTPIAPSAQQWANMTPSQQDAFKSYVGSVAGANAADLVPSTTATANNNDLPLAGAKLSMGAFK